MPNQRQQLTIDDLEAAKAELATKLRFRANQKSMGAMASNHEILGILSQELEEYNDAIHNRLPDEEKVQELLDITVAAIWGIASIRSRGIDW
jgi:hypothetical protein